MACPGAAYLDAVLGEDPTCPYQDEPPNPPTSAHVMMTTCETSRTQSSLNMRTAYRACRYTRKGSVPTHLERI